MKHIATMALMLTFGVASVYAEEGAFKFSGASGPSAAVLQAGVPTAESTFTGNGMLGAFTFHNLTASAPSPGPPPSGCMIHGTVVAGGGVFRFADGSLLIVNSAQGTDCIQLTAAGLLARCLRTFKIAGGTGRFKDVPAGGTVSLDETVVPVFPDNPVFFAVTGTGTISGVAVD